jgi:hypothetical protein
MTKTSSPAHLFFQMHVKPNLDSWHAQPPDERLAMNAVVSLYHLADHFWQAYSSCDPGRVLDTKSASEFRGLLAKRDVNFAILRDVAEAYKHMKLDRTSRKLTKSNQTALGSTGFGEAGFGTGPFGGGASIVVDLDDGSKYHLSYITRQVKQAWDNMLA